MKYNYINLFFIFSLIFIVMYYFNYSSNKKEGFRDGFSSRLKKTANGYKRMWRTNYNLYSKMFSNYLRPFKKIL